MMRLNSKWMLLGWMLAFALIDQGTKWLAKLYLTPQQSLPIIPDVFQLTLAYNTGAAFSILRQQPQLLAGFTTVLFLVLLAYGLTRKPMLKGEAMAMALILGGALGNLLDRLFLGRVTDFLDVIAIHYPIFNVADSFIFCGVIGMVIIHLRPQPAVNQAASSPIASAHDLPESH